MRGPSLPPAGNFLPFWESNPYIWQESVHVNVNGTFLVSHVVTPHLIANGWGRIVNINTSLVGLTQSRNSPYGVTKYVGELYAQTFGRCYGLENVCLRYFNIFGPRQDPGSPYSGVMAKFCTAFLEETEPVIFGDGSQSRDFTYVDNAVQANLLACEAPSVSGKVFNIGTGDRISLNDVVDTLGKISGRPLKTRHDPPRDGDIRDSQADIDQARALLGYEPTVRLEEGLQRTYDWYRATQAKIQSLSNAKP